MRSKILPLLIAVLVSIVASAEEAANRPPRPVRDRHNQADLAEGAVTNLALASYEKDGQMYLLRLCVRPLPEPEPGYIRKAAVMLTSTPMGTPNEESLLLIDYVYYDHETLRWKGSLAYIPESGKVFALVKHQKGTSYWQVVRIYESSVQKPVGAFAKIDLSDLNRLPERTAPPLARLFMDTFEWGDIGYQEMSLTYASAHDSLVIVGSVPKADYVDSAEWQHHNKICYYRLDLKTLKWYILTTTETELDPQAERVK